MPHCKLLGALSDAEEDDEEDPRNLQLEKSSSSSTSTGLRVNLLSRMGAKTGPFGKLYEKVWLGVCKVSSSEFGEG